MRYENCKDCGVKKVGAQRQRPRCRPCGNKQRAHHGTAVKYYECVECGVAKTHRGTQMRPLCRACSCRLRAEKSLKRRRPEVVKMQDLVGAHIRNALKRNKQGQPCFQHLPYSVHELMEHLEKQFSPEMSWDNQGSYWHLDHIVPQALLPYDSYDHPNFLKCWDLRNLQPLPASKNCAKGARLTEKGKALMELL